MNERIEHCLYQAGLTANGCWDELGTYEQEAIEKFAELIVAECLNVINQSNGVGDDDVIKISMDVKEHFGVEE